MQYARNVVLSVGSFFSFFQTKIENSFYSKLLDSRKPRTTRFSGSKLEHPATVVPNVLRFIPNIFRQPKLMKHQRFPFEYFRHCDPKTFRWKVRLLLPFNLLSKNFIATGVLLKDRTEGFPYEYFRHCDTKTFRRRLSLLALFTLLSKNLIATGVF